MIYELRIYHMFKGRMEAIHKRFANETLRIFKKHGIKIVDFWEDAEDKPKIYYILEYKDFEDRNTRFNEFKADPEWIEVKKKSELDGPIVEKVEEHYMKRVPYSPLFK
jgi:hypothetical protein